MGNKYDRHTNILNILIKGQRVKCSNLAFEFNVSIKTIKKDISELSLHYPINTYPGRYGGIEINKGFAINGYIMKPQDISLIIKALILLYESNPDPEILRLIALLSK